MFDEQDVFSKMCSRSSERTCLTTRLVGEGEQRKYYRVLKGLVVSNAEEKARVMDMLGDAVFKNLAMRVVVDSEPEEASDAAQFISELRGVLSLHFA